MLPADFTSPITYDKMKDPVVASDGHSYERTAIEEILRGPHPISPLTRATLGTVLVPNLNLRRRIEEHEAELDRMVEQVAARMADVAEEKAAAALAAVKAVSEAAKAALRQWWPRWPRWRRRLRRCICSSRPRRRACW